MHLLKVFVYNALNHWQFVDESVVPKCIYRIIQVMYLKEKTYKAIIMYHIAIGWTRKYEVLPYVIFIWTINTSKKWCIMLTANVLILYGMSIFIIQYSSIKHMRFILEIFKYNWSQYCRIAIHETHCDFERVVFDKD